MDEEKNTSVLSNGVNPIFVIITFEFIDMREIFLLVFPYLGNSVMLLNIPSRVEIYF